MDDLRKEAEEKWEIVKFPKRNGLGKQMAQGRASDQL